MGEGGKKKEKYGGRRGGRRNKWKRWIGRRERVRVGGSGNGVGIVGENGGGRRKWVYVVLCF